MSMKPGATAQPDASSSRLPRSFGPISRITPPAIPTSAARPGAPLPSKTVPPRMTMSAIIGPFDPVDRLDPGQDRPMHQSPGLRVVRYCPMHHAAVVPHEEIADLPFVPVDDFPARRMGAQLLDEGATLGFGHVCDMVHRHAEDE